MSDFKEICLISILECDLQSKCTTKPTRQ